MMKALQEIISRYQQAERDRTFPLSEWQRKDIFERLVKDFLIILGYNPDQINYDDVRGVVELEIRKDLRAIIYITSIQEEQRFLANKISAPIDTIPDPETGKPEYEIACVTNFEKWFFYFDGKEVYAVAGEKLEEEFDTVNNLISRSSIESGKFKEVARALLHKEDNEPLRQELNILRVKIADKILQEKTNIQYLKNPDGIYSTEILNEITTRWITRFLALKLAEDSGISFNFTLRDIRRSFELCGKTAKPLPNAKVKEETLSNAIRALMNEFERRYNGGIFMYEEGVDYITFPDSAFFDLLEFTTGWAFTIEDARIIGFVYENAILTAQQKLLDEWHKRAKNEPIEKTFDVLITQTRLARIFLKEVFFEKIKKIKEKIEFEINRPLIKYFNSEKRVLRDKELKEILGDETMIEEELKFVKDRATEISKSQPPKAFNWEIEFPEVFFGEDGTLKENPGFDCVVGNPPYIRTDELSREMREGYKNLWSSYAIGKWDVYYFFYALNLALAKEGGAIGYITPNKFLVNDSALSLRLLFLNETTFKYIIDLSGVDVFTGSIPPSAIFIFEKTLASTSHQVNVDIWENSIVPQEIWTEISRLTESQRIMFILGYVFRNLAYKKVSQQKFRKTEGNIFTIHLFDSYDTIVSKMERDTFRFGDLCERISEGDINREEEETFTTERKKGYVKAISSGDLDRYIVNWRTGYIKSKLEKKNRILFADIAPQIEAALDDGNFKCLRKVYCAYLKKYHEKYIKLIIAELNATISQFYYRIYFYPTRMSPREGNFRFRSQFVAKLPIKILDAQQAQIISLVDAISQKKKEYHAISQNIEDYIDFGKANLIRLDEFLKGALDDFEVVSSLKAKHDNFDALRLRIEGGRAIVEYRIRRKVEDYEEIEEDEQVEVRGKYVVEWHPAGEEKIKDGLAVEFLAIMLEKEKRFSKAKSKTIWQKIAEVKVPEFTGEVKEGLLRYKSAMEKAKKLDEEITRIDRAIDRLVYDLYGFTEDEIKVVEKSVWGEKFEEMYSKLPSKEGL